MLGSGIVVIVVSSWLVAMQVLQAWGGQGVVGSRRLAIGGLHIAIFWGWRSTWGYVLELYVGHTLVLKRILVQIQSQEVWIGEMSSLDCIVPLLVWI